MERWRFNPSLLFHVNFEDNYLNLVITFLSRASLCRYGTSMRTPKLQWLQRTSVNSIAETVILFFTLTTPVRGRKIIFCTLGMERIASR